MKVEIINCCPVCNSSLIRIKDQLFCKNPLCEAQSSKKIEHFSKTLNIKGLGEKTIEKLELESIEDIYALLNRQEFVFSKIGDKLGTKLLIEIQKTLTLDIGLFLAAMSIPLVGKTIAAKLKVSNISDITYELCRKNGIGEKASNNIINWINEEYYRYVNLPIKFNILEESVEQPNNIVVCISGKIKGYTKSEIKELLEAKGFTVVDNITKQVNVLITEVNNKSSKVEKAIKYGIKITTFDKLI